MLRELTRAENRFLKHTVLPLLERAKDVEKVHQIRPLTEDEIERRLSSQPLSKAARKVKTAELADKKIEEWVWLPVTRARRAQLEQANNVAREKARQEEERKARKPFGWEVGVGTDYAHLSKRRQRSRQEKVKRNLGWMKELAQVRKESLAAAEAAQTAVPHVEQAPGSMGSA